MSFLKNPTAQMRVAIFDYPKLTLEKRDANRFLSELIAARELGYKKASENYVAVDKLDMIGTHILVYDCADLYNPKLVSGLRLSYSDRCEKHGLKLPMDENIQYSSKETQAVYQAYKKEVGLLVESNGWFINNALTMAKKQIDIAQIILATLGTYLLRRNITNWMTATNERFKASRRVTFGEYEDGHMFVHPSMPDPHKIILIKSFSMDWMKEAYVQHHDLLTSRHEVYADELVLRSFNEVRDQILGDSKKGNVAA